MNGVCGDETDRARICTGGRWRIEGTCACPAGTVVPDGFVCAPSGRFTQGNAARSVIERDVTLTQNFFIQVTEVTQSQWLALMGNNPSADPDCGGDCPVNQVSWLDSLAYANAKSASEGLAPCYDAQGEVVGGPTPYACQGYRLLTDVEWEYAYHAGTQGEFYWGDDEALAGDYDWYYENANDQPHPVAQKLPNAWGIYDMAGNVTEWINDEWWSHDSAVATTDPWTGGEANSMRTTRGGSCLESVISLRAVRRGGGSPDGFGQVAGLRLARSFIR